VVPGKLAGKSKNSEKNGIFALLKFNYCMSTVKKMVYLLYLSLIIVCLMGVVDQFAPSTEHEADEAHTEHEAIEEHTEHEVIEEHTEHAPFVFENIPIFNAIFGLIMCIRSYLKIYLFSMRYSD